MPGLRASVHVNLGDTTELVMVTKTLPFTLPSAGGSRAEMNRRHLKRLLGQRRSWRGGWSCASFFTTGSGPLQATGPPLLPL